MTSDVISATLSIVLIYDNQNNINATKWKKCSMTDIDLMQ